MTVWLEWPTTTAPCNWNLVGGRWYWTTSSTSGNPLIVTLTRNSAGT